MPSLMARNTLPMGLNATQLAAQLERIGYPYLGITLEHRLHESVAPDLSFWHDGTEHVVYVFYARSEPDAVMMEKAKAWFQSEEAASPEDAELSTRLIVVGQSQMWEHFP